VDINKIQKIGFLDKVKLLFKPMKIAVDKGDGFDYGAECKYKVMNGHIYIFDCTTHKN